MEAAEALRRSRSRRRSTSRRRRRRSRRRRREVAGLTGRKASADSYW